MGIGIPIIDRILGIGEKAADRLIPDKNKRSDQAHDRASEQIKTTAEGERNRNWYTPRAIIMYVMATPVVYMTVIRPFAKLFGVALDPIEFDVPARILLGLLGLDLIG